MCELVMNSRINTQCTCRSESRSEAQSTIPTSCDVYATLAPASLRQRTETRLPNVPPGVNERVLSTAIVPRAMHRLITRNHRFLMYMRHFPDPLHRRASLQCIVFSV